jgi:hypothetical protein
VITLKSPDLTDLLVLKVKEETERVSEEGITALQEQIVHQETVPFQRREIDLQDMIDQTTENAKQVSSRLAPRESMTEDLELEEERKSRRVVVERVTGARKPILGTRIPKKTPTRPLLPLLETHQKVRPRSKLLKSLPEN